MSDIRWHQVSDIDLRAMLTDEENPSYAAALEEHERRQRLAGQPEQRKLNLGDEEEG